MRYLRWVSILTIFAMLFVMLPATVAEDEIVIGMEEAVDEELEIVVEDGGLEGFGAFDDSSIALDNDTLDLEDNLLISEEGEYTEVPPAFNASGEFEIDEDGTLTRYGGFATNVAIPYGVKQIGNYAFQGYTGMVSVSIPDSVTYIGMDAFGGCTGLKSVTIPEGVETIYFSAFSGCTSLTDVTLPDTLKSLYSWAFRNCTSLRRVAVPSSVTFNSFCDYIFQGCSSLTNIQLPSTMTELPSGMFSNCDSLDNLDFLSGITKISDSALSECDGLKSITIPSSVTVKTFNGKTAKVTVTVKAAPKKVTLNKSGTVELAIGKKLKLKATLPKNTASALTWKSSKPKVASVDKNGTVKALKKGTTVITVKTFNGKTAKVTVKVK